VRTSLRLGACQTPELLGDVSGALAEVEAFAARADIADLDLLDTTGLVVTEIRVR